MLRINLTMVFGYTMLITTIPFLNTLPTPATVKPGKDQIIIKYTIKNPKTKSINLYLNKVIEMIHKEVPTVTDSYFSDTIFTAKAVYLTFYTDESVRFYGEPGAVIKIQLDSGANLKQRVKFSGDLSEMNNYLLEIQDLESRVGWSTTLIKGSPEDFMVRLDSINSTKIELLNLFQKKSSARLFWKNQKEMINVSALFKRFDYINTYKAYHKDSKLSEEWRKRIKPDLTTLFVHPELLDQSIMRDALDNYIFFKSLALANQWISKNKEKLTEEGFVRPNVYEYGFQYVIDSVKDNDIRNFLFYDLAERGLSKGDLKTTRNLIQMFNDHCTNKEYVARIQIIVDSHKAHQPGEPAIEIIGYDVNGKKHSLSDFKGKLVYVDVWASWCGPCIGEFPSFKTLVNAYKDKNIVFIQYSVNEEKSDWLNYRGKNPEMDALCLQLIKEPDAGCKIMNDYKIDGIPRYLLFDAKGRIISTSLERPEYILETKFLDKYFYDQEYH